jgi:thymidylate kinase
MFVTLEGLHGAGKSTVADMLANRLQGGVLIPTIPCELKTARRFVDRSADVNARYLFYLSAVSIASDQVRALSETGRIVIAESFIHRTVAFHAGMGASARVDLRSLHVPTPDFSFYLHCDDSVRRLRLLGRNATTSRWRALAERRAPAIADAYAAFPLIRIDTTEMTCEQVCEFIVSRMGPDAGLQSVGAVGGSYAV